jgi:hypothetical protein
MVLSFFDCRIRVRIARKRNDDEDIKEKLYSYPNYAPTTEITGKLDLILVEFQLVYNQFRF